MKTNNIKQCTITLNRSCNLRCDFCYAKGTEYNTKEIISFEDLKRIVNFCKEKSVEYIVFTGGEPTLYPNLFEIVKFVKDTGISPSIATNGLKLTDFQFCEYLLKSGIDYIDISIKGYNIESYKNVTGIDGYEKCLNAISNLSELDANFNCSMVLTKNNINNFCEAVSDVFTRGAKSISFTFEIDNEDSQEKGLVYLEKENPILILENFFNQIDLLNEITKKEWWIEFCYPLCFFTEKQLQKLENKIASPCQIRKNNGITFDGDMNLIPCNMFYKEKLGKFGSDFLTKNDFDNYIENGIYADRKRRNFSLPSSMCHSCKYLNRCVGGCPVYWSHFSMDDFNNFVNNYYETKNRLNT